MQELPQKKLRKISMELFVVILRYLLLFVLGIEKLIILSK